MHNVRIILHISFIQCLLYGVSLCAQEDSLSLQKGNYDVELIDSLLFEAIVKERKKVDLPGLFKSSEMRKSAKDHVDQISVKNQLFYKEYRKGQCLADIPIQNMSLSHQEVVNQILNKWLASSGHKDLILGPLFIYGASATKFHLVGGQLYLKAVFYVSYNP